MKRGMLNIKKKMRDCRDGKIMAQRNGMDVPMMEWEKWPFLTDGRIIFYLFIYHCDSSFTAAKNSFLTNCIFSMFLLSFIQVRGVREKLGV